MTETSPWTFDGETSPLSTAAISTLVDGRVLAISANSGDINGELGPHGLFFLDSRIVSRFEVVINGKPIEPLGMSQAVSFAADYIGRNISDVDTADHPLVAVRHRSLGNGMIESIEVRNYDTKAHPCNMEIFVEADFADLFAVKERRAVGDNGATSTTDGQDLFFVSSEEKNLGLKVKADITPENIEPKRMKWSTEIAPGESWKVQLRFVAEIDGQAVATPKTTDSTSARIRHEAWFQKIPKVTGDNMLISSATAQSLRDLESLRIFSANHPDRAVVAAGAPWFMTLFGRDSLLTSWMSLIVDPDLATGVLQTLAQFQGSKVNPDKEEEPGKIMHEVRFNESSSTDLEDGDFYYGTADATPLFVMTLGELDRWGESPEIVESLLPNADRAMDWIINYGDADGDGYVEYDRSINNSLFNQGWKDSGDGIRFNNGDIPETPMALCEIQAYTFGAYRARARLARNSGDAELAQDMEQRAATLRENFNRDFWIEDKGWFAVGLDHEKKQIDSLTSNIGHCLWTGIVDQDKARIVADHLMSEAMFTGWGIRTMANDTTGYNPTGYHTGSVWPHDSALVAAGLMRYGFVDDAHRLMVGLLELAQHSNWRLPELISGFSRDEFSEPIPYPASCSPQAWSAASTLLILRWLLRLDPWCPEGRVWIDPVLPEGFSRLKLENLRLAGNRIDITIENGEVSVDGLPDHIEWQRGLREIGPREKWN